MLCFELMFYVSAVAGETACDVTSRLANLVGATLCPRLKRFSTGP